MLDSITTLRGYTIPSKATTGDYEKIQSLSDLLTITERDPRVRVVSFDLMDTLIQWSSSPAERHIHMTNSAVQILEEEGIKIPHVDYKKIRDEVWYKTKKEHEAQGSDYKSIDALDEIVQKVFAFASKPVDRANARRIATRIEEGIYQIERRTTYLSPLARQTLSELRRKGIKTVVYSNTPFSLEHVRETLRRAGILEFFDIIYSSSEVGLQKSPTHSEGFKRYDTEIRTRYRLRPEDKIIHIGDSRTCDYNGSLRAGFFAARYASPTAFAPLLNRLDPTSQEYRTRAMQCTREALDDRVNAFIDESLSPEKNTPELWDFFRRAYLIGREQLGPSLVYFGKARLRSLNPKTKKKYLVCLGRDGLGAYEVMKTLLEERPEQFPGVAVDQLRYLPISRSIAYKALRDGGYSSDPLFNKDLTILPEDGDDGYRRYKSLLRAYLEQNGFDEATDIRLIDTGIHGTVQTAIQLLFPELSQKVEGRYLYLFRKKQDLCRFKKREYFVLSTDEGRTPYPQVINGHPVFAQHEVVYFFEDLFNGIDRSNSHFDETALLPSGTKRISPRVRITTHNEGINPDIVPPHLRDTDMFRIAKTLIVQGLRDAAILYGRAKELDPSLSSELFPSEEQAKRNFTRYLEGYVDYVRGKTPTHPDQDIFNTFVRRVGYHRHEQSYEERWRIHLRKPTRPSTTLPTIIFGPERTPRQTLSLEELARINQTVTTHLSQGDYTAARRQVERALEAEVRVPWLYFNYAQALAGQREYEHAAWALQEEIKLNKNHWVYAHLAYAHARLGNFEEAHRIIRMAQQCAGSEKNWMISAVTEPGNSFEKVQSQIDARKYEEAYMTCLYGLMKTPADSSLRGKLLELQPLVEGKV